jgi:hypothetical protein
VQIPKRPTHKADADVVESVDDLDASKAGHRTDHVVNAEFVDGFDHYLPHDCG